MLSPERLKEPLKRFTDEEFPGTSADQFFGEFGVGNTTEVVDRPLERFREYEELLAALRQANPAKYASIHKGTPFFFLSWLAFDMSNYETALFYLDAGIAEDIRNIGHPDWQPL